MLVLLLMLLGFFYLHCSKGLVKSMVALQIIENTSCIEISNEYSFNYCFYIVLIFLVLLLLLSLLLLVLVLLLLLLLLLLILYYCVIELSL